MHILFLTQILPYPLDSGAKVRAYFVLRYLAARHRVTLVSFSRASDPPAALAHLRTVCHAVHTVPMTRSLAGEARSLARSLVSGQPYTLLRDERRAMHQLLQQLVQAEPFDAIHADQLAMADYAWQASRVAHASAPRLVLDAHNAYYLIPQRMAAATRNPALRMFLRREARLMARAEGECYRRFDHLLTVTPEDRAAIETLLPSDPTAPPQRWTMPICVDTSAPPLKRQPAARGLLLLGGLHWPPNADGARWFLREVWPLVRQQAPQAQLFIVGARPPADLQAAASARDSATAPDGAVIVPGYVTDPQPFLAASAALIVPLRSGGGMRVKIVEALQWGLPVISTTIGCEGIEVTPGRDLLVADTPAALAAAAVQLLQDPTQGDALAANGRRLLAARYDWRREYTLLDAIYPA